MSCTTIPTWGVVGMLGGGALGDAAVIPGPAVKHPRGIRRVDDWLMAHAMYPDYIKAVFRYQTDIMLKNLQIYKEGRGGTEFRWSGFPARISATREAL